MATVLANLGSVMLSRLEESRYPEVKRQHRDLISQFPLINAVASRLQKGLVYADLESNTSFIATKAGFSLLIQDESSGNDGALLDGLRRDRDLPSYIHIYSPPTSFATYVANSSNHWKLRRRAQFRRRDTTTVGDPERPLPSGFRAVTIDDVGFDSLEQAFKLDFGGRYWNSREHFLDGAIGACILNEKNEPAAICYSACIVEGVAEMDTLVVPQYRGRGFMRIVSELFFKLAAMRSLIPHWDTFVSNKASYIMAQKFNLDHVREYDLLSVVLRQTDPGD
jgi:GNAT acetyltransferase-like protein